MERKRLEDIKHVWDNNTKVKYITLFRNLWGKDQQASYFFRFWLLTPALISAAIRLRLLASTTVLGAI